MRITFRIFLLVIGLVSSLCTSAGSAGELIEFPNLAEQAPASLLGYLARPDGGLSALLGGRPNRGGPYPAVVVLHGCGGISSHSVHIADQMGSWGYAALTVDSLGPRGMTSRCGTRAPRAGVRCLCGAALSVAAGVRRCGAGGRARPIDGRVCGALCYRPRPRAIFQ